MDKTRDKSVILTKTGGGPETAGDFTFPFEFWEHSAILGGHPINLFEGANDTMGTAMFGAPLPRSAVMTPVGLVCADDDEEETEVLVVGDWGDLS